MGHYHSTITGYGYSVLEKDLTEAEIQVWRDLEEFMDKVRYHPYSVYPFPEFYSKIEIYRTGDSVIGNELADGYMLLIRESADEIYEGEQTGSLVIPQIKPEWQGILHQVISDQKLELAGEPQFLMGTHFG